MTTNTKFSSADIEENVLVLQGGGSLGAFGCGVFKALAENNIKIDIISGTSIGGVNASIITGHKNIDKPEKLLEQFWLELSDGFQDFGMSSYFNPFFNLNNFMEKIPGLCGSTSFVNENKSKQLEFAQYQSLNSFYNASVFGNEKMFKPRWSLEYAFKDPKYYNPYEWTYLYDNSPLVKTLDKYIDYNKLNPNGNRNSRLIMTAVNILTSEPLIFDSNKQQILPKHILATSGYPLYNLPWTEVESGVFAWDGGLLSNTPLKEAIDASPVKNKRVFIVENYPKKVDHLPHDLPEVHHRARDIIFSDKTQYNISMAKVITMYLRYIDEMYQFIDQNIDPNNVDKKKFERIKRKYKKYKKERGAEIKKIHYITRDEHHHSIYENADFSPGTIKESIKQGELKTNQILEKT
ncbi:MAG: patatin-like phospholipase family protein [Nitrososphaeraceae archaeon]